ncbi:MAG: hypothetical protein NWE89_04180 [Candidatus Bathyarchaeota archaeon]|nr:hypothetical protein [Candidatus Bathyarchaeota archaeon]
MDDFLKYVFAGVAAWVVVDFSTVFNPDVERWVRHMPLIWVFYIGYPLLFGHLIYRRRLGDRGLVSAMLVSGFVIEVVLSGNALLYTFPIMVVMIPVAVAIYSCVTFIPRWIVDGEIRERKRLILLLVTVWIIVSVLNYITNVNLPLANPQ